MMHTNKSGRSSQVRGGVSTPAVFWFTAVLVVVAAAGGALGAITKGPFLLGISGDGAALMWESDKDGLGTVTYHKEQESKVHISYLVRPERIECEIQKGQGPAVKEAVFIYKTRLEGLERGQVYNYRVSVPGVQSETYRFRTPTADSDEVRFIVYGDSRTNPGTHRKLVELMMNKKVDFVVNVGDLVSRGSRYEQWGPQFFEPLKGLAETVPVYIAKGNHDRGNGYFEKLLILEGEKNNYGFDYGPVHYFCVDNVSGDLKSEELLKLIWADVQSSKARWKFVSYHIPSINFGGHWSKWGYPDALRTLSEAGVDFVLTGHSHQYERFRPIAPAPGTDGSFVTYVTSGGGGAGLSNVEATCYHASAKKIHHFCLFHIKGNKLTMDTIDIDGKIIDHLGITKTDGRLNKQYLWTAVPMEEIRCYQELKRKR